MKRKNEMRRMAQRMGCLALFAGCTRRELEAAGQFGTPVAARAGKILARQGSVGREVFLVEEGALAVEQEGQRIATVGPGEIAGEMAVLWGSPRCAQLVAETNLVVTVYTPAEFRALLEVAPSARVRVFGDAEVRRRATRSVVRDLPAFPAIDLASR